MLKISLYLPKEKFNEVTLMGAQQLITDIGEAIILRGCGNDAEVVLGTEDTINVPELRSLIVIREEENDIEKIMTQDDQAVLVIPINEEK